MADPRLWVDFNDVYHDNLIEVDLDFSRPIQQDLLESGRWVRLYDDEGNECEGVIESRSGRVLTVKLDFSTLRSVQLEIVSSPRSPLTPVPHDVRGGRVATR
jgi:hypothetical protein